MPFFNHRSTPYLLILLTCFMHQSTHAITFKSTLKWTGIGAAALLAARVCTAVLAEGIEEHYHTARNLLVAYRLNPATLRTHLRHEILRAHHRMVASHWFTRAPYRNYPLVWYVSSLDNDIRGVQCALILGHQNTQLLDDLYAIRDVIITDYEFIQERRQFELHSRFIVF